jgi:Protein of unknown function (DUF3405)
MRGKNFQRRLTSLKRYLQLTKNRLNGFFNGVASLVEPDDWVPEQEDVKLNITLKTEMPSRYSSTSPPIDPVPFNAYEEFSSAEYLEDHYAVQECFLDSRETVQAPDIFAYPGVPQNMTKHFFGSYKMLGLRDDVCWDRFGRFGPYGYGYDRKEGGLGLAEKSEKVGTNKIWSAQPKVDWRKVDWASAQKRCYEKNSVRFQEGNGKKKVARQAYILRAFTGYKYDDHQILTLRAMITELNLKSGGEYDVHLLVQVKDDSIPIWTDKEIYQQTLEESVPEEFWGISTLWSEELMRLYYPGPFPDNFENPSGQTNHGVYRGAHFPLFWFAQQHPEYDYYWNWEMDLRYTGHYYEFNKQITNWAKQQARKGLWERNAKYYIEEYHGDWQNFTKTVEDEIITSDIPPIWGPVTFPNSGMLPSPNETKPPASYVNDDYDWGVGEEADYLSFNPIFDPAKTNWVFRNDVDGYSRVHPIPPRRIAIITVARLSKRLLNMAHKETYKMRHTMFPEMWPPTIALHHGYKAVYIPHPVYFHHNWELNHMNQIFNYPRVPTDSVFGFGEHYQLDNTFYYHATFAGNLWRRWFGYREESEGGTWHELTKSGRMCLKSTLFHPVKYERGPTE